MDSIIDQQRRRLVLANSIVPIRLNSPLQHTSSRISLRAREDDIVLARMRGQSYFILRGLMFCPIKLLHDVFRIRPLHRDCIVHIVHSPGSPPVGRLFSLHVMCSKKMTTNRPHASCIMQYLLRLASQVLTFADAIAFSQLFTFLSV